MTALVAGCAKGPEFSPLTRTLPPAPSFAAPVALQPGKVGESCYVALNRNENTTFQANSRITRFRGWYQNVRASYNPKVTAPETR